MNPDWEADRANISTALRLRKGTRTRRSSDGTEWLDHHCLFHDDSHRSASWNEITGVYYCRTEDRTFLPPQVMERLFLVRESRRADQAQQVGRKRPRRDDLQDQRFANRLPDHVWTYVFPDGHPSHMKWRWDEPKRFIQVHLDGSFGLPDEHWPIYGDFSLPEGLHIVVVEGEKCVDRITQLADRLDQIPIRAVTCGSVADTTNHKVELAARLGQLAPQSITLWPDNDEPGLTCMRALHQELSRQNILHSQIAPAELGLPLKGDVVDYADRGDSLATLIARQTGSLEQEPVRELVLKTLVTDTGQAIFPESRRMITINEEQGRMMWKHAYHQLPSQRQLQDLLADLRLKSHQAPVVVAPRVYTNEQVTWWRPNSGPAIKVAAEGLSLTEDPPGTFLLTPNDGRHVDSSVDLEGRQSDLLELLSPWDLKGIEVTMIIGWLVCAMGGLQTPILFMRSPAATGKTTMARFLLSVIEPMCPEIRPRQLTDERHFALALMKYPVALIDNVSRMDSAVEDTLSQLVTGYTASIRPLYTDQETSMFLRRGLIITTTNYDIYKGDLHSRTVVVEPSRRISGYLDDRTMQRQYAPLIPKVRGYVMNLLATYYQKRGEVQAPTHFRIGDLGKVLAALGYDVTSLAAEESLQRAEVASINDPWVEAIVDLWREEASVYVFKTTKEILDWMREFGCEGVPAEKSRRLSRWFAEKSPFFLDYGFEVEHVKNNPRGYRFRRIEKE